MAQENPLVPKPQGGSYHEKRREAARKRRRDRNLRALGAAAELFDGATYAQLEAQGVGRCAIGDAVHVLRHGSPALVRDVRWGKIPLATAARRAKEAARAHRQAEDAEERHLRKIEEVAARRRRAARVLERRALALFVYGYEAKEPWAVEQVQRSLGGIEKVRKTAGL